MKNIVQNAIDTGDLADRTEFGTDTGKRSGKCGAECTQKCGRNMAGQYYRNQKQQEEPKPYGPGNGYSTNYSYRPFGHYRSPESSRRVSGAREEFALFVNTGTARAMGILLTTLGTALTIMFGVTAAGFLIASIFVQTVAGKAGNHIGCFWNCCGIKPDYGNLRKSIEEED